MSKYTQFIIAIFVIGIISIIVSIGKYNLTNTETALLSIVLTIISIIATWLVSHYYSKSDKKDALDEAKEIHDTNLKTYGRQAAEKVHNLSNELTRLSNFLELELENGNSETVERSLQSREQKISSAIHILSTLKSIADTTLSDWKGVVGDYIEQQKEMELEEEEARKEALETVLDRIEKLFSQQIDQTQEHGEIGDLKEDISSIRKEMRSMTSKLLRTPVKLGNSEKIRKQVKNNCPVCLGNLIYRHRRKKHSTKALQCPKCNSSLFSIFNDNLDCFLMKREKIPEVTICPFCQNTEEALLDNYPSATHKVICGSCKKEFLIHRTVQTKTHFKFPLFPPTLPPEIELDSKFINSVKEELPDQPWPTGIHKQIAKNLNAPNIQVQKAINILIKQKIFYPQFDGVVYYPKTNGENKKT